MVCACLSGAVRADSTIEVIKGTSKQRVRAGEASREVAPAAQELPRVEVFVTDWCPYCQRLEAFLKENQSPTSARTSSSRRATGRSTRSSAAEESP
jgi:hypothetical protein